MPGSHVDRIARIASRHQVYLSVGITERHPQRPATMWNTNLVFSPHGDLIGRHRKLVPTWAERLTWAYGDARGLEVLTTDLGRLGALICGENFNTLCSRFALLAMGEQVHVSTYPPVWPVNHAATGTGDAQSSSSSYNLADAIRIRAGAHAIEGKVFNIVAACCLDDSAVDAVAQGDERVAADLRGTAEGCSMIIHPSGAVMAEIPEGKEDIALADIDTYEALQFQELHDIAGHYNRFDIFKLHVDLSQNEPLDVVIPPKAARGKEQSLSGNGTSSNPPLPTASDSSAGFK